MSKFTPGPWKVIKSIDQYNNVCWDVVSVDGGHVTFEAEVVKKANAHLIAAAPDMYEALSNALKETREQFWPDFGEMEKALAKARGEL